MKIKKTINKNTNIIIEYDNDMNMIYRRNTINGKEEWFDYNDNGDCIFIKDSTGYEKRNEYNEYGKLIYSIISIDEFIREEFLEYNKKGILIHYTTVDGTGEVLTEKIFNAQGTIIYNKTITCDNELKDKFNYEFVEE